MISSSLNYTWTTRMQNFFARGRRMQFSTKIWFRKLEFFMRWRDWVLHPYFVNRPTEVAQFDHWVCIDREVVMWYLTFTRLCQGAKFKFRISTFWSRSLLASLAPTEHHNFPKQNCQDYWLKRSISKNNESVNYFWTS